MLPCASVAPPRGNIPFRTILIVALMTVCGLLATTDMVHGPQTSNAFSIFEHLSFWKQFMFLVGVGTHVMVQRSFGDPISRRLEEYGEKTFESPLMKGDEDSITAIQMSTKPSPSPHVFEQCQYLDNTAYNPRAPQCNNGMPTIPDFLLPSELLRSTSPKRKRAPEFHRRYRDDPHQYRELGTICGDKEEGHSDIFVQEKEGGAGEASPNLKPGKSGKRQERGTPAIKPDPPLPSKVKGSGKKSNPNIFASSHILSEPEPDIFVSPPLSSASGSQLQKLQTKSMTKSSGSHTKKMAKSRRFLSKLDGLVYKLDTMSLSDPDRSTLQSYGTTDPVQLTPTGSNRLERRDHSLLKEHRRAKHRSSKQQKQQQRGHHKTRSKRDETVCDTSTEPNIPPPKNIFRVPTPMPSPPPNFSSQITSCSVHTCDFSTLSFRMVPKDQADELRQSCFLSAVTGNGRPRGRQGGEPLKVKAFDSCEPTVATRNLGSPHKTCGGPALVNGAGGRRDADFANCENQGTVLILQDGAGDPGKPKSADGGRIKLEFARPVDLEDLGIINGGGESIDIMLTNIDGQTTSIVSPAMGKNAYWYVRTTHPAVQLPRTTKVEIRFTAEVALSFVSFLDVSCAVDAATSTQEVSYPTHVPSASPSSHKSPDPSLAPTAVPSNRPSFQPSLLPSSTPSHNPSTQASLTPTTKQIELPNSLWPAPGPAEQVAVCTNRHKKDFPWYDSHQNSRICPSGSFVCKGGGKGWKFAHGNDITKPGGAFSATLSCVVADGTSTELQITVKEKIEKIAYAFDVLQGSDYGIVAVNMKASNQANFCTWPSPTKSTGILMTPVNNANNKSADLSHADICVSVVSTTESPTTSPSASPVRTLSPTIGPTLLPTEKPTTVIPARALHEQALVNETVNMIPQGQTFVHCDFSELDDGASAGDVDERDVLQRTCGFTVIGVNPDVVGSRHIRVLDTSDIRNGMWDLGSPHSSCGGQKNVTGSGGRQDGPFRNCNSQGNVLYMEEDWMNQESGGCILLEFVDPVNLAGMGILNASDEYPLKITVLDGDGDSTIVTSPNQAGRNSFWSVNLTNPEIERRNVVIISICAVFSYGLAFVDYSLEGNQNSDKSGAMSIANVVSETIVDSTNNTGSKEVSSCGPGITGFYLVDQSGKKLHGVGPLRNGQVIRGSSLPLGTDLAIFEDATQLAAVKFDSAAVLLGDIYEVNYPYRTHSNNFHIPGNYSVKAHGYGDTFYSSFLNTCEIHFHIV